MATGESVRFDAVRIGTDDLVRATRTYATLLGRDPESGSAGAVRFALGLGEAVVYPASNRLVAAWIPFQERGRANGVIFAGVGAGAGLAPPLITYILLKWGWRWPFWIRSWKAKFLRTGTRRTPL